MKPDRSAVLDACVLIPMPLADTLLRMAEAPRLYRPRWSRLIMDEVTRNLISKFGMPAEKARRRESEVRRNFPEAWIQGFEGLIEVMSNDPGDRHVLAAAVHEQADLIVTYNLRHFPGRRCCRGGLTCKVPRHSFGSCTGWTRTCSCRSFECRRPTYGCPSITCLAAYRRTSRVLSSTFRPHKESHPRGEFLLSQCHSCQYRQFPSLEFATLPIAFKTRPYSKTRIY
jgi:predicted nucleic acid-binding protein